MIQEFEFYHGAALTALIHSANDEIGIKPYPTNSNSSYVLNNAIGIYIKYSTKRLSPWRFMFNEAHLLEILEMKKSLKDLYLILVCGSDGIVTLNKSELKKLISKRGTETKWLSASRSPGKEYLIRSSDAVLDYKIAKSEFPKKIVI
jgi:hypothetical protein